MATQNLERGRCRLCGMLCDFSGQVYCRNCLKQFQQREKEARDMMREANAPRPRSADMSDVDLAEFGRGFLPALVIGFLIGLIFF